jgi:5-methylcytosine-specific restriction endonuclease McrA
MSEVKSRPRHLPCAMCGQQKTPESFYWYPYITQQGKNSIRRESRCKECARQRRRDRYAEDPVKDLASSGDWKIRNKEPQAEYRRMRRAAHSSYEAKRRAAKLQRTVVWADLDAINDIYDKATATGLTVDHIIPLQGVRVSGLHVQNNLRLLSKSENSRKKNSFAVL